MLLISYICSIVSIGLKLLQVVWNRTVVLKPRGKKLTYSSGQKAPLKVQNCVIIEALQWHLQPAAKTSHIQPAAKRCIWAVVHEALQRHLLPTAKGCHLQHCAYPAVKRTIDSNCNLIWQRFCARHNKPKLPLDGRSIMALFVTTVIDLQWHCNSGGKNLCNSTRH